MEFFCIVDLCIPSHLFILSVIYLYGVRNVYFILWVMTSTELFLLLLNCSSFGYWQLLQVGSAVHLTCPYSIFWAFSYFLIRCPGSFCTFYVPALESVISPNWHFCIDSPLHLCKKLINYIWISQLCPVDLYIYYFAHAILFWLLCFHSKSWNRVMSP